MTPDKIKSSVLVVGVPKYNIMYAEEGDNHMYLAVSEHEGGEIQFHNIIAQNIDDAIDKAAETGGKPLKVESLFNLISSWNKGDPTPGWIGIAQ